MRLVVVGDQEVFQQWLETLPPEAQKSVRPIERWSEMLNYQRAVVQFMRDWRTGSARTQEENDRIWNEAVRMDEYRRSLLDPFARNTKGGKQ